MRRICILYQDGRPRKVSYSVGGAQEAVLQVDHMVVRKTDTGQMLPSPGNFASGLAWFFRLEVNKLRHNPLAALHLYIPQIVTTNIPLRATYFNMFSIEAEAYKLVQRPSITIRHEPTTAGTYRQDLQLSVQA